MSDRLPTEIVQHDKLGRTTHSFPVFAGAPQYLPRATNRGDYEKRVGADGQELISGACAACGAMVRPTDHHVIRYSEHIDERGGIFHAACAPTGAQWFGVGEKEE